VPGRARWPLISSSLALVQSRLHNGPVDEFGLVEAMVWRVKAIVSYANSLPAVSGGHPDDLSAEVERAAFDHVESAEEALLTSLLSTLPPLVQVTDPEFEERMDAAEGSYARVQPATREGLCNLFVDAVQLLEAAESLSELQPVNVDNEEALWDSVVETRHELEAALLAIDPSWYSARLAKAKDDDERIELASRFEHHELRTERLKGEERILNVLSDATDRLGRLEERDPILWRSLRDGLGSVSQQSPEPLRERLVAAGFTEAEAALLIASFLS
jgi:hypothetical protein